MFIDRMASNKPDSIHSVINRCAYRASEQSRPRRDEGMEWGALPACAATTWRGATQVCKVM